MAHITICDATGEPLTGDRETINELAERVYSPDAAESVRAYLKARDELQERLAGEWTWGLLKLREEFREKFPDGKLPDEF
jgi:hypothetical protein